MKRKPMSLWITTGLFLAAALLAWFLFRPGDAGPTWRTGEVTRGSVEATVTATGSLQAVTTVEVGTQVSGVIASLYADFNSTVHRNQVIARLDTTLLYAALQDARSGLQRVTALQRQANAERERARSLFARELISRAELEQAEASASVAEANTSSARAQVERAEINLRYAIIRSPVDGIVLSRDVDPGQTVAASLSAPTLFIIAEDLREMRVQAAVDEADIGRVRDGQTASFTVDAYPDTVFTGVVEQVRLQPIVTQNVVTYDVILRVRNPDLRLMPGMTANLAITVAREEDALRVPAAALYFAPPGEAPAARRGPSFGPPPGAREAAVHVLENGTLRRIPVRAGVSDGIRTAVEGPLNAGDAVVVGMTAAGSARQGGAPFGMQQGRRRF